MLRTLEFHTTVANLRDLPAPMGMEVAFVGRSNAGKSSAINALAQRKRVAYVSKTPGRTQLINYFMVGPEKFLVDLPGYGFAAVPAKVRQGWNDLIGGYVQTRANLRGLVMIMDARHPLTPLDRQLLSWFQPRLLPVHVLLSKCDKLGRQQAQSTLGAVTAELGESFPGSGVQLFSATNKIGLTQAAETIMAWLEGPHERGEQTKKPPVKGSKPGVKP